MMGVAVGILLVLSVLWAASIAALLARAIIQYGKYEVLRAVPTIANDTAVDLPPIAAIIPARNECETIGRLLEGVTAQDYPTDRLRIYIIDDHCDDGTAEIVRSWAQRDPRVHLLTAPDLPPGWVGKPNACWYGANEAMKSGPIEWLCFMDADTAASPALLRMAVTTAQKRKLDFLSLEPTQELLTIGERLLMPAGFLLLAFTQDLGAVNDPAQPDATANGQFIMMRREPYTLLQAHSVPSVRNELSEDAALARLFKGAGYRIALLGTEGLLRCRMFRSFGALWEGLGKNLTDMIGGGMGTVLTAISAFSLATAAVGLPVWALVSVFATHTPGAALWCALACSMLGSLALLGTHIGAARYLKIPWGFGVLFPIGYLLGGALAISAVKRRARRNVRWKGRIYQPSFAPAPNESPKAQPTVADATFFSDERRTIHE